MAKEWAKDFYDSKQWRDCRDYILSKNHYICQKCSTNPAEIVHHKIWLNSRNIHDPNITLNEENLIPVCRECHAKIHEGVSPTIEDLMFDENGDLIRR